MTIDVQWNNPSQTILIYTFSNSWNWDDYYAATDRGRVMMADVRHRVDVIYDFEQVYTVPSGALRHFGNTFRGIADAPDNLDRMVVVGATGLLSIIANVLRNLYPSTNGNVFEALTREQALAMLVRPARSGKP